MSHRHDLIWLRPQAPWRALTPQAQPRLREWFAAGHPAVVARRDGSEPAGALRLGVPLPAQEHKQRLTLYACATDIARQRAPLSLAEVLPHAPSRVHHPLHALGRQARELGIAPGVYGSFAWQALTGLSYVHERSDLDLLWPVADAAQADAVAAALHAWEHRHGLRADGELRLPDGAAVNWREYAGDARQLLLKSADDCALRPRESLFAASAAA